VRVLLISAALFIVGLVSAFLFYVPMLSIITSAVIVMGLVGTLSLGYWAGLNGQGSTEDRVQEPSEIIAPAAAPELRPRIHIVGR
jgi:hypothetical protein